MCSHAVHDQNAPLDAEKSIWSPGEALLKPYGHHLLIHPAFFIGFDDHAWRKALFGHSLPLKNNHRWQLRFVRTTGKDDSEVRPLMPRRSQRHRLLSLFCNSPSNRYIKRQGHFVHVYNVAVRDIMALNFVVEKCPKVLKLLLKVFWQLLAHGRASSNRQLVAPHES